MRVWQLFEVQEEPDPIFTVRRHPLWDTMQVMARRILLGERSKAAQRRRRAVQVVEELDVGFPMRVPGGTIQGAFETKDRCEPTMG